MLTTRDLSNVPENRRMPVLLDAIGAGAEDPRDCGPKVVVIKLWDGRSVSGSYHRCEEDEIDIVERKANVIIDDEKLRNLVDSLLTSGKPFVSETGESDDMCTLRWTIE